MSTDVDLAWAAGFFDGEGNIRWNDKVDSKHRGYGRLTLQMAQIDRQVLDRFKDIVQAGKIYGPYNRCNHYKPNWNLVFRYEVNNKFALEVFNLIRPFLSPVKIHQSERPIQLFHEQHERIHGK